MSLKKIKQIAWTVALVLGVAFVAVIWSGVLEPKTAGQHVKVRVAFPSKGGGFWPNYVALKEGFYTDEGLDVEQQVVDPHITVSALIGGAVEISFTDATQLLYGLDKQAPLVAVGLSLDRQPYRLMAGPGIKTVADLKGKKIGAAAVDDVFTYAMKRVVREGGLDPDKDVEFVIGGNQTRRMAATLGGALDAGLFSPPSDGKLAKRGYTGLAFMPDIYPNLTLSAEAVRRDWAEQNGDVLRRYLRAEERAIKWLNDPRNKQRALQIVSEEVGGVPEDSEEAYDYYFGQKVWRSACIRRPGLVNTAKIMRELGQLKTITETDVPKFTDTRWCAQVGAAAASH